MRIVPLFMTQYNASYPARSFGFYLQPPSYNTFFLRLSFVQPACCGGRVYERDAPDRYVVVCIERALVQRDRQSSYCVQMHIPRFLFNLVTLPWCWSMRYCVRAQPNYAYILYRSFHGNRFIFTSRWANSIWPIFDKSSGSFVRARCHSIEWIQL